MKDLYADAKKVFYTGIYEKNNEMMVCQIKSVSDYLRAILMILSNYRILYRPDIPVEKNEFLFDKDPAELRTIENNGLFFRGEPKIYDYQIPSIYRDFNYFERENQIVRECILEMGKQQSDGMGIFETLTYMQHYGLNTRLLDVSKNALSALFFATEKEDDDPCAVYIYANDVKKKNNEFIKSPWEKEVIVKSTISLLSYEEKCALSQIPEDIEDISVFDFHETYRENGKTAIDKIMHRVVKETNNPNIVVSGKDLYGLVFVEPYYNDMRMIQQSGGFILFGLEANLQTYDISANVEVDQLEKIEKLYSDINAKENEYMNTELSNEEMEELAVSIAQDKRLLEVQQKKEKGSIIIKKIQADACVSAAETMIMYSQHVALGNMPSNRGRIIISPDYKKGCVMNWIC